MRLAKRSLLVALASLTVGCARTSVATRVVERDVTFLQPITLLGLPARSRVFLDAPRPAERRLLAFDVSGDVAVTFPRVAHEQVRNGIPTRTLKAQSVAVVVHAPFRTPKRVELSLAASSVRIDMDVPLLPVLPPLPGSEADVDAGLEAWIGGRCQQVRARLGAARTRVQDPRIAEALDAAIASCVTTQATTAPIRDADTTLGLDPKLFGSPEAMLETLRIALDAEKDKPGLEALRAIVAAIGSGQLGFAARLSGKLAEPLSPKRAALALALPRALHAKIWLDAARSAEQEHDDRRAFELALEARAAAPRVAGAAFEAFHRARARSLEVSAKAARSELVARGYWTARAALLPGDEASLAGLARTEASALAAARMNVAVNVTGDPEPRSKLLARLREKLPRHAVVVEDPPNADVVLDAAVLPVVRTHKVTKSTRQKRVYVGDVTRPNPEHEEAQREVVSAEEGMRRAEEQANELRRQAEENRARAQSTPGWGGVAFAGVSGVGAGAAEGILASARSGLQQARAHLARTPATVTERVEREVSYPVLVLESKASIELLARVDGLGPAPFEVRETADTSASREHVEPQPSIDVAGQAADAATLESLTPAIEPASERAALALVAKIREAEEQDAWAALQPWLERDLSGEGAMPGVEAAVVYLTVASDAQAERRGFAVDFLVRRLP